MPEETKSIILDRINIQKADQFFSKYELKFNFDTNIEKKYYLGDNQNKTCRFCGRGMSETSFKKDAHVIPQLLGNHKLLSNYECDRCNELFSNFENSMASFLGPFRTIVQIKGKKGTSIPTFKEPNSGLVIRKSEMKDVDTEILNYDNNVTINESEKSIIIKCKRNPFVPIYIYKLLVKSGLCLINDNLVNEYEKAFKFLKINQKKHIRLKMTSCNMYFIPGAPLTIKPFVQLWERIEEEKILNVVKHSLVIYLQNLVFQVFLPYNSTDILLQNSGVNLEMPPIPLLYDHNNLREEFNYYKFETIDLSHHKKRKYEPIEIHMRSDKKPFKIRKI